MQIFSFFSSAIKLIYIYNHQQHSQKSNRYKCSKCSYMQRGFLPCVRLMLSLREDIRTLTQLNNSSHGNTNPLDETNH